MTTLLHASVTAVLMSLISPESTPALSARPESTALITTTFSAVLARFSRTFGSSAIPYAAVANRPTWQLDGPRCGVKRYPGLCHDGDSAAGDILPREPAQLLQRASQQARDLHLRKALPSRYLSLGHVPDEAHVQHRALSGRYVLEGC